jgi:hypothetical protein
MTQQLLVTVTVHSESHLQLDVQVKSQGKG